MVGPASDWAMTGRRSKEYRRKVNAATPYAPHLSWSKEFFIDKLSVASEQVFTGPCERTTSFPRQAASVAASTGE